MPQQFPHGVEILANLHQTRGEVASQVMPATPAQYAKQLAIKAVTMPEDSKVLPY